MALAVALGLSRQMMHDILETGLLETMGWAGPPWSLDAMRAAINLALGGRITFADLPGDCDLRIVATRSRDFGRVVFSRTQTPDVVVEDAVIASCSMPFVFPPVLIEGESYVDGAVVDPFPLQEFPHALGFYLDAPESETKPNVIAIPVPRIGSMQFRLTGEQIEYLRRQGLEALELYKKGRPGARTGTPPRPKGLRAPSPTGASGAKGEQKAAGAPNGAHAPA
jgi:hypothetical protein